MELNKAIHKAAKQTKKNKDLSYTSEYTCVDIADAVENALHIDTDKVMGRLKIHAEQFCLDNGYRHTSNFINHEVANKHLLRLSPAAQKYRKELRLKWLNYLINKTK